MVGSQRHDRGSLVCIGLGMMLGAHMTPRARAQLDRADVVFVAASDAVVELWVQNMRPDARSLQPYYQVGKSRFDTYREMVGAMLDEVRAGKRVCGAFYGHPGVFAKVPHDAIALAREEGFVAQMEPAVSAEDCLYADLGIDPGRFGCQHFEASQLLFYRRTIDPSAYLVLWQIGVVGDRTYRTFASSKEHRALLVERLSRWYPASHEAILYEAATLPIDSPRCEPVSLRDLPDAKIHMQTTLVIPPAADLDTDDAMLRQLARLDAEERRNT